MSETDDDALIAALWRVVANHGWQGLTMGRLAAEAGLPMAALRARFPTRFELLLLHGRTVDRAVLAGTIPGQGGEPRDRVFDVMMRRLDALQPHRAGVLRFLKETRSDPGLAALLMPQAAVSMRWMLDAAEIETDVRRQRLLALGLVGVWIGTLRAWIEDESEDLSHSMAALDRLLDRAGQIGRSLHLLPREAPRPAAMAPEDA